METTKMLEKLYNEGYLRLSIDNGVYTYYYIGLRQNVKEVNTDRDKFIQENCGLIVMIDTSPIDENVELACKHMMIQKEALPTIL